MGDDLALVEQVRHGQHRQQRRVLQLHDGLVHQGRDHLLECLRQDHAAQGLHGRHAQRLGGLGLAGIGRNDAASDDLGIEGAAI
ncbi:hypothetical protein D3C87_1934230 [compost metagenome]